MKKRKLRILYLPADDGGCGWLRIRNFQREIENQELAETYLMDGNESEDHVLKLIENSDVVVARNGTAPLVKMIKDLYPGKHIVFDHDDNTFEILPSNEHYRQFGTQDVVVPMEDGDKPLWVTGNDGFNRFNNLASQLDLTYLLSVADLNTAPVRTLASEWAKYNGNACVVPNCIDFALYPDADVVARDKKKGEIRIGWMGGVSHQGDWDEAGKTLSKIMREDENITLDMFGSLYPPFFKGLEDRIRYIPWLPFQAYSMKEKLLDWDFTIIPLQEQPFNTFKSEIKFSDAAANRIPIIVRDMLPYSEVAVKKENCLTYKTQEELDKSIRLLIEDKALRKTLSDNAYEWVKKNRDLKDYAKKVVELYKSLLTDEERLAIK